MTKMNTADKALVGVAVTIAAQRFDDLKQVAHEGRKFSNEELVEIFSKTERLLDGLTEFFVQMVEQES